MTRLTIHALFATLALLLLATSLWHGYKAQSYKQLTAAIDEVTATVSEQTSPISDSPEDSTRHPAVLLAHATALSNTSHFDAAETAFVRLIDQHRHSAIGRAAQYNLANHYLREGSRSDLPGGSRRPLLGIAKQRYRDLLQSNPEHWQARHNLEVALRLSPETPENKKRSGPPPKSVRVIVPDFEADNLP